MLSLSNTFPYTNIENHGKVPAQAVVIRTNIAGRALGCTIKSIEIEEGQTPFENIEQSAYTYTIITNEELESGVDFDITYSEPPFPSFTDDTTVKKPFTSTSYVQLYRDSLWECFLMLCMLLARQFAPDCSVSVVLSTVNGFDGGFLQLTVSFTLSVPDADTTDDDRLNFSIPPSYLNGFMCLRNAEPFNQSTFSYCIGTPVPSRFAQHASDYPVVCHLAYLRNSSVTESFEKKQPIQQIVDDLDGPIFDFSQEM